MTGPVGLQECIDCISWKQNEKRREDYWKQCETCWQHISDDYRIFEENRAYLLERLGREKQRRKGLSRHLPICSIGHRGWMRKIILFFWIIF